MTEIHNLCCVAISGSVQSTVPQRFYSRAVKTPDHEVLYDPRSVIHRLSSRARLNWHKHCLHLSPLCKFYSHHCCVSKREVKRSLQTL